ncbi:MAG: hypothetical protein KF833_17215 [Verrucomicrobiae bacterium]|nr:hypothetical protein [Verrucomicrobiae bacterium]
MPAPTANATPSRSSRPEPGPKAVPDPHSKTAYSKPSIDLYEDEESPTPRRPEGVADLAAKASGRSAITADLEAETRYIRRERQRAAERFQDHKTRKRTSAYTKDLEDREDLAHFDPDRLHDLTDFDYRFRHREHLPDCLAERMGYVAAKLAHLKRDGCQRAVKTGQWWAVQNQPRVR